MAMTGGTAKLVKSERTNYGNNSWSVNLYVYYKVKSQSIADNTTTLLCGMYVTTPAGYPIGPWYYSTDSYVGTKSNVFDGNVPNFSGTRWLKENVEITVPHNPDGTGKATIYWKWGVNSPWGQYVNPSGSFTIDLAPIARATVPTLSATGVKVGSAITITMNRKSSSFVHKLRYKIGSKTDYLQSASTEYGTSYKWTVPYAFVSYMPNKTTEAVTLICETWYNGSKIGENTAAFSVTVPDASVPTVEYLSGTVTSAQMGQSVTIRTNRKAAEFTHKLTCSIGGTTKDIASSAGATAVWTIPDLVSLMPNATSAVATITCVTKNGTATVGTKAVKLEIKVYDPTTFPTGIKGRMGESITIALASKSSIFRHDITYTMGDEWDYIDIGAAGSVTWKIPVELVGQIPNKTSGEVTLTCVTKNGTAIVGITTIKATLDVPSASVPSLPDGKAVMGETVMVSTNTKSPLYTHKLTISLNDKKTAYNNVKDSEFCDISLDYAKEIPDATETEMNLTCATYNGTALVGTKSIKFTATVPDNEDTKPQFSVELMPVHDLISDFDGLYIQGKSRVEVTFDAKSEYSNIKSYHVTAQGSEVTGNPGTTGIMYISGETTVKCTVTDTRGYSRVINETITVIPYAKPRLAPTLLNRSIVCTRCDVNGVVNLSGEYVLVQTDSQYSKVMWGEQHNFITIEYRYKVATESDYSLWQELVLTDDGYNGKLNEVFDKKKQYTVQLRITDLVGEDQPYTFPISDISVPLHLGRGGKNVGLGQFCDYSHYEAVDIGWTTYFNMGIGHKVIFEAPDAYSGLAEGDVLETVYPDSDTTGIMDYTLYLALVKSTKDSMQITYPVLCVRVGKAIYGSLEVPSVEGMETYSIKFTYSDINNTTTLNYSRMLSHIAEGSHGAVTALGKNGTYDEKMLTALYALI